MRLQRIKDRATNDGLQAGSGGQNLTGFRDDWAATLPPDQTQPKPPTVPFFPFATRIPKSSGEKVVKSEYDTVKASHKYDLAGDPATAMN